MIEVSSSRPAMETNQLSHLHHHHHVVLFPFMAQGHITPFLSLAEFIHHHNPSFSVTLVNTPANILSLQSSLPPDSPIRLRSLPFSPSDHGLPANAECAAALPFHHFPTLFRASESLRPAFEALVSDITRQDGRPPLCIIADNFFAWTVDVANKFNSFHAIFITSGAYGTAVFMSLWTHLPHTKTPHAAEFSLPEFPDVRIHRSQLPAHLLAADGADPWSVFLQRQTSCCFRSDSMLINTVEELETIGLAMLRKAAGGIPVYPVGPLLRTPDTASSSQRHFVEWLEFHPTRSVVYIAFGSQNTIRASQMMELARGLEASGKPFIWVIRPPVEFDISAEFKEEWLPEGFEERTAATRQGMVVHGWAPQVEILGHGSTGAFLSHCGWNSVLESLSRGVPIIGWPLSGDQLYNSKMLEEEVGVCLEVARGNREDSRVEGGEVERVVGVVVGGETNKGRDMRRRAAEVAEMLRAAKWEDGGGRTGGPAIRGLEGFLEAAIARRRSV